MRGAPVRKGWVVGLAVAGLLAAGAVPAAADDTAVPTTVPTITVPAGISPVVGADVTLTATTTNPSANASIKFIVDGTPVGSAVPVGVDGASTTWPSWGLMNGSPHVVSAADCNSLGCNQTASLPIAFTVQNPAPAMTAPLEGATTDPTLTLTATTGGGGLAFYIDHVFIARVDTAPYSVAIATPLADGPHTASVAGCGVNSPYCFGPNSPDVHFTVVSLHPAITLVAPPTISPNHDGQSDSTAFRVHLPDAETVSFHVENGNGQTVSGPHTAGLLAAGDHVYHWDGKNNAGKIAGDGSYSIVVQSAANVGNFLAHGRATAPVIVDTTAPLFSGITGNNTAFYPIVDGYRDAFQPSVHVNEGGRLWLELFTTKGARVNTIALPHAAAGTFTPVWNGTDSRRRLMPDGAYRYKFVADDAGHNRRISASYVVHLSRKRIVNRAASFTQNGDAGLLITTDTTCTGYSYGLSLFPHGVWLSNVCDPSNDNFQVVAGDYLFKVPAAVRYNAIRVEAYGNTSSAPEPVLSIIYNNATKQYDPVGVGSLTKNNTNVHTTYGTVHGSAYVDGSHFVDVSLGVPNVVSPEDYDIGTVTITVSYSLLQ